MTDPNAATVFQSLVNEVEIPQDGTLSRVLFRDDRLRVVIFAFDEGQELTEHTASVPAVLEVVSGRLRLTLVSEVVEATPGTWVYMPAHLPHSILAREPSVMLLSMIRDDGSSRDRTS